MNTLTDPGLSTGSTLDKSQVSGDKEEASILKKNGDSPIERERGEEDWRKRDWRRGQSGGEVVCIYFDTDVGFL